VPRRSGTIRNASRPAGAALSGLMSRFGALRPMRKSPAKGCTASDGAVDLRGDEGPLRFEPAIHHSFRRPDELSPPKAHVQIWSRRTLARVGAAFRRAPRSPAFSVGPVGVPARLPSGLPSSRARAAARRESAGRKQAASDAPAHSPAADVGAMPTWHRNSLGSRAGSPTRATCCKAIFSTASPPYPKGGA